MLIIFRICVIETKLDFVSLGWSGRGSVIRDHSDRVRSNEAMNPFWTRIYRFIWSTMIRVTSDHWSWSGSSQRNAPLHWPGSMSESQQGPETCVVISAKGYCHHYLETNYVVRLFWMVKSVNSAFMSPLRRYISSNYKYCTILLIMAYTSDID